jgi:hypothetical protein
MILDKVKNPYNAGVSTRYYLTKEKKESLRQAGAYVTGFLSVLGYHNSLDTRLRALTLPTRQHRAHFD